MSLVLAVAIAACASQQRAPTPPASSVKELLALLDAGAARACACQDRACTEEAEADLAPAVTQSTVPPRWIEEAASRKLAFASEWRAIRCMQAHDTAAYAFASLAIRYAQSRRDEVCACKDDACIAGLQKQDALPYLYAVAVPFDQAAGDQIRAVIHATDVCMGAPDAALSQAAYQDYVQLRDRACACVDDACVDAVKQDIQVVSQRYQGLRSDAEDNKRFREIGYSLGECLGPRKPR